MDIAVFFFILVLLVVLVLGLLVAMLRIVRGLKGGHSIYQDTIRSKHKVMEKEIESLKSRLKEIEKKLNL